ncbi:hypothetical protein [Epilithonimonas sp.]|uniref:hypothetical protein n=1 Tax=Epilithonimonas sp. TaxID=2894511 RepID=UPI0028ACB24B|nr:hypothetical protein [Epilithonimonas sp.]
MEIIFKNKSAYLLTNLNKAIPKPNIVFSSYFSNGLYIVFPDQNYSFTVMFGLILSSSFFNSSKSLGEITILPSL